MTLENVEGHTISDHKTYKERKREIEVMNIYKDYEGITDEKALEYLVELQIERDELLKKVNNKLGELAIGVFCAMIGFFLGYAIFAI